MVDLAKYEALQNMAVKSLEPQPAAKGIPMFFTADGLFDEARARDSKQAVRKTMEMVRVEKADDDLTRDLQLAGDDVYVGMMLYKMTDLERKISNQEAWEWMLRHYEGLQYHTLVKRYLKEVNWNDDRIHKALDTAESGGGADFVPTNFSSEFIEDYRQDVFIFNAPHRRVRMTSDTFELPGGGDAVKSRMLSEQTGDNTHTETNFFTAVDPNTASPQLSAKKLGFRTVFSVDLVEESVIPLIPFVQSEGKEAAQRGFEQAAISGDTNATHQDYDVHSASGNATDSRRAFLGFRGAAMDQSSNVARVNGGNTRPTDRKISDVLVAMGKYGKSVRDTYITGPAKARHWLRALPEDRFSSEGGQDYYDGYPCYWSDEYPTNLHDTGINTNGGDNDTTGLTVVCAPRWIIGDRRDLRMKVVDREETDQKVLVVSEKVAFRSYDAVASVPNNGYLYNLK